MTKASFIGFACLFISVAPVPGAAQLVRGQVVDSSSGEPVANTFVSLAGLDGVEAGNTISDERGIFLLRAPVSGNYQLMTVSDGYRRSSFPPFGLQVDQMRSFVLLLPLVDAIADQPDDRTVDLASRNCADDVTEGHPVIVGTVLDASSSEPVPNARIYYTAAFSRTNESGSESSDEIGIADADRDGNFAVCGVPSMTRIALHAVLGDRASDFVALLFGTGGVFAGPAFHRVTRPIWRQDLEIVNAGDRTATLTGSVTDTAGVAVAGATVEIVGTPYRALTNANGRFTIDDLTRGNVRLRAKSVGFSPVEFDMDLLPSGASEVPDEVLTLAQFPTRLRDIVVTGDALHGNPRLDGFFARRENSPRGKFATREDWRTWMQYNVTDVLGRLRYGLERSRICYQPTSYFLDGVYIYLAEGTLVDSFIDPTHLDAIEAYGNGFDAPVRYRRHGCGTVIMLWSKPRT